MIYIPMFVTFILYLASIFVMITGVTEIWRVMIVSLNMFFCLAYWMNQCFLYRKTMKDVDTLMKMLNRISIKIEETEIKTNNSFTEDI